MLAPTIDTPNHHIFKLNRKDREKKNKTWETKASLTLEEAAMLYREIVHMYICPTCGFIHRTTSLPKENCE